MEQLDFNLLFRWFVGLGMDEAVWDHSTFTHNRDRLLTERLTRDFLGRVVAAAQGFGLMSDAHCTDAETPDSGAAAGSGLGRGLPESRRKAGKRAEKVKNYSF